MVGGISRTVDYKGNKIDIGGHRFFSKFGQNYKLVDKYFAASRWSRPDKIDKIITYQEQDFKDFFSSECFLIILFHSISDNIKSWIAEDVKDRLLATYG